MRRRSFLIFSPVPLAAIAAATQAQAQRAPDSAPDTCASLSTQAERDACARSREAQTIGDQQSPETIVVTGSRLRRSVFTSPDPVTIIDPDLSRQQGQIETAEILQSSPIAAGSTQITSVLSSNFVTNGGFGAQTISLRGLGAERTLVLLNGRRAGPAGVRGSIASFDLNVLPSSVIQSVEILKTGASSIYGSDAVAGVVNLITRRNTNGIEVRGFGSWPLHSGGENYDINATFGRDFGRGHFLISADYNFRDELERRDRSYLDCQEDFVFSPDGERRDIVDPRTGRPACFGTIADLISVSEFADQLGVPSNLIAPNGQPISLIQFNRPGDRLDEFLPPLAAPTIPGQFGAPAGFFPVNFDGPSTGILHQYLPLEQGATVIPRTERWTLFATGGYEVAPNVELYAELLFNRRKTRIDDAQQIFFQQFTGDTILPFFFCGDSVAICDPNAPGDPLNTGFSGDQILQPIVLVPTTREQRVDYYRAVGGARGDFGSWLPSWRYDGYLQYSRSDGDYSNSVIFQDAIDTQQLRTGLCAGTTTRIRGVPCIDINWTDPRILAGDFTPQEQAFLFGRESGNTLYTQWTGELSVNGNLFTLPAGDVQLALGTQWRQDRIRDTPGEATLASNAFGTTGSGITAGRSTTKELFGEIQIPLIHDTFLIQDLTFSGAARLTNVSARRASDGFTDSSNGNWTYKLGLNWQATDWLRFRGTYGTSFRAPALFELFLADETGFFAQTQIDPCIRWQQRLDQGAITQRLADNCAADGVPGNYTGGGTSSAEVATGGGIGVVEPETSRAWTASVIFTPAGGLWKGMRFSLAVDYFDIDVRGEITQLGPASILSGCYNSEFFPDDPLCDQFDRVNDPRNPRDNQITNVRDSFININRQRNRGIDVVARMTQDMGPWGNLQLQAQMTWQLEDTFALFQNTTADDNGEAGEPIWVGDFDLIWRKNNLSVVYGLNVVGGTSNREDLIEDRGDVCFNSVFRPGTPICPDVRLSPTFYHSISATIGLNKHLDLTVGINNIFDTHPPRASVAGLSGITLLGQTPILGSQYDLIGRRVFVGVAARM